MRWVRVDRYQVELVPKKGDRVIDLLQVMDKAPPVLGHDWLIELTPRAIIFRAPPRERTAPWQA